MPVAESRAAQGLRDCVAEQVLQAACVFAGGHRVLTVAGQHSVVTGALGLWSQASQGTGQIPSPQHNSDSSSVKWG